MYPGSGKSIVTTLSPPTGTVIDSNVGGYFGPYLKFSGFDALYKPRGRTKDGIPTVETVRRLSIDFSDVLELLEENDVR